MVIIVICYAYTYIFILYVILIHHFLLLSSGAVGVSLYGNDDLHNGVVQFQTSARALDDLIISVKNQVKI